MAITLRWSRLWLGDRAGDRLRPRMPAITLPRSCLWAAAALATMVSPAIGHGQRPEPRPVAASPPYVERVWRTEDGLPNDIILVTLRTRDGYLWLGTQSGLTRFDGVSFATFGADEAPGLVGRAVRALHEDRAGNLWIGTDGGGLFRHRDGRFTRVGGRSQSAGAVVRAILEDRAGDVWIGSELGVHGILSDGAGGFEIGRERVGGDPVAALAEDTAGSLWIGTWESGLLRAQGSTVRRITAADGLPSNSIRALAVDPAGTLWVGTWGGGLASIAASGEIRAYAAAGLDANRLSAVHVDNAGLVRAGSMAGLLRVADDALVPAAAAGGLAGRRVTAISEDDERNLWLGTYNDGLIRLRRDVVAVLTTRQGLRTDNVRAVLEDGDGALWIATKGGGVHRLRDGRLEVFTTAHGLLSNEVFSLHLDSAGVLWAGSTHGLNRFDGRRFTGLGAARLRDAIVLAIHRDAAGTVWVGTEGAGLNLYADGAFRPAPDARLSSSTIRSFQTTADGSLWIGTEQLGLFRYRDGVFSAVATRDGPGSSIRGLYRDAEGALWIGSFSDGLSRLKDDTLATFGVAAGLVDNQAWHVVEDGAGRLWMSSDRGIFYTQRTELEAFARGRAARINSHWYGAAREYNGSSQPAAWRARDGRLYFASMEGLVVVDPRRLAFAQRTPPVRVERVVAGNRSFLPGGGEIRLEPAERDFRVDYTALALSAPDQVRFRYRLGGYDRGWQDAGARRMAFYTKVPAGRYTFDVVAYHPRGVWPPVRATLALAVAPYFFETTWFAALCVLAAILVAGTAYGWRVRRLKARERGLQREVEARTRDLVREKQRAETALAEAEAARATIAGQARRLRELDQARSRFFANISHEFRTPLTLILGPVQELLAGRFGKLDERVTREHERIQRSGRRLLRLISQILDLAKVEHGHVRLERRSQDLVAFTRGLVRAFTPLCERRRIRLRFDAAQPSCAVAFDAEQLEKVLTNLLSNAVKFTPAGGKVVVGLGVEERTARIDVRDTGIGIPPEHLPHVFDRFYQADGSSTRRHEGTGIGLALARELAALHGGTLRAESTPGAGSVFTLLLPRTDGIERGGAAEPPERHAPRGAAPEFAESAGLGSPPGETARSTGSRRGSGAGRRADRTTILVVEDNAEVRAYVRSVLEPAYRVLEAADGVEGLERARAALPDLVLADLMMPRMDGLALSRAVREDPAIDCIPVILLTARAGSDAEVEGLESGADAYIVKPFDAVVLRARIAGMIASRQRLRERLLRRSAPEPAAPQEDDGSEIVRRLRGIVEANVADEELNPEFLARAAGLNYKQIYRRLAAEAGTTPSRFIRAVRVECAARLLADRAGSITEVAYGVGFNSLSYFNRCFRERFGIAPSDYLHGRSSNAVSS